MINLEKPLQDAGMTRYQLAKGLGVSTAAVCYWERRNNPKAATLLRVAEILNCSVDTLLGREVTE